MVGDIEVGEGIDVVGVGVFVSLRQFRKREHRQIFGLRFLDGLPLYIPVNPLVFTGLDGVGAHLLYPFVDKCGG